MKQKRKKKEKKRNKQTNKQWNLLTLKRRVYTSKRQPRIPQLDHNIRPRQKRRQQPCKTWHVSRIPWRCRWEWGWKHSFLQPFCVSPLVFFFLFFYRFVFLFFVFLKNNPSPQGPCHTRSLLVTRTVLCHTRGVGGGGGGFTCALNILFPCFE